VEAPGGHLLEASISWLKLGIELFGALLIAIGAVKTAIAVVRVLLADKEVHYTAIRLSFGRYLSMALEFQLAADILGTAFDPTVEQIGKLGAIAVIRTALNFFLQREIAEEQVELTADRELPLERSAVSSKSG
jgi:uncharacterized membrane protein